MIHKSTTRIVPYLLVSPYSILCYIRFDVDFLHAAGDDEDQSLSDIGHQVAKTFELTGDAQYFIFVLSFFGRTGTCQLIHDGCERPGIKLVDLIILTCDLLGKHNIAVGVSDLDCAKHFQHLAPHFGNLWRQRPTRTAMQMAQCFGDAFGLIPHAL